MHHDTVGEQGLAEYDFGQWDGRSVKDLRRAEAAAVEAFWRDPEGSRPPCAEPLEHLRARVCNATVTLIGNRFLSPAQVLLVTHAGVMRILLKHFRQLPLSASWNIELPPAGLLRLDFDVLDGEILHTRLVRLDGNGLRGARPAADGPPLRRLSGARQASPVRPAPLDAASSRDRVPTPQSRTRIQSLGTHTQRIPMWEVLLSAVFPERAEGR